MSNKLSNDARGSTTETMKIQAALLIGFLTGMIFCSLAWLGSPREFNERNANNMALQKCITVLEAAKTADKDHEVQTIH